MGAGAGADLAFVFWISQRFIGRNIGRIDTGLVIDDDACTGREAKPFRALAIILAAQVGRDTRVQHGGFDRLEETFNFCAPDACGIDHDDDVGRAVLAFVFQALKQCIVIGFNAIDFDAGLFGEVGVQQFIRLIMAGRVQVQHFFLCLRDRNRSHQGNCGE
ncbi:hypothetical protein D3C81_1604540 [compost metagenome]